MFNAIMAHFLLVGWLSSLIAALPTTRSSDPSLSLENVSLQSNNTNMNQMYASQIIRYVVPQTQLLIVIYTGSSIGGLDMRNTLEVCLAAAHATMDKYGNVYMFPDPYLFKPPAPHSTGLEISAYSTMVPGLKWTDLVDTLNGVEQIMLRRIVYKTAHIKMYDEPSGMEMGIVDLHKSPTITLADHGSLA